MTSHTVHAVVRTFFAAALLATPAAGLAQTGHVVTVADIRRITGLTGVHVVSPTAPGSVAGEDNYADASGRVVLFAHEFPATLFQRAKAQAAKVMNGIIIEPKLYHAAVRGGGLGDEAFDSPDGPRQRAIYVRKGKAAFALTANVVHDASGDKPTVTMDQLKALAKLAASRM